MIQLPIPISPEAVTEGWLTDVLRGSGTVEHASVARCTAERIGEGAGIMSQLVRVHLEYDLEEPDAPRTLIAKFPTEAVDRFFVGRLLRLYERESGFYAQLRQHVPVRTPRCYYNALDHSNDDFVLLLEDLAPGVPGDQLAGAPLPKVELAIEQAAALHAALWEHPVLTNLPWMPSWNDRSLTRFFSDAYRKAWPQFRPTLPAPVQALGNRLESAIAPLLDQLSQAPRTLLHGDFRLDNLFFPPPGADDALAIIDWQLCAGGRGVADVAYLLSQSVAPDIRKTEEMRLVRRYHQLLLEHGVDGYSLDECLRDYRRAILAGLVFLIVAMRSLGRMEVRGPELATAMIERTMAAVVDLNAADLLP